jgi:predicted site-specific integrase-resolvase
MRERPMVELAELLSTRDVARILDRSVESVRGYANAGKLAAIRLPSGQRVFQASDVARLAETLRQGRRG